MNQKDLIRTIGEQCSNLNLIALREIEGEVSEQCAVLIKQCSHNILFELEKLQEPDVNIDVIEKLIHEFKKERLLNANTPWHHEAEISAGFEWFIEWLNQKKSIASLKNIESE